MASAVDRLCLWNTLVRTATRTSPRALSCSIRVRALYSLMQNRRMLAHMITRSVHVTAGPPRAMALISISAAQHSLIMDNLDPGNLVW